MAEITKGEWKVGESFNEAGNEIPIYAPDHYEIVRVFIHNGEQFANARLIVTAVNACQSVNPDNPQAVAESIIKMYEALKAIYSDIDLQNVKGGSDELNLIAQNALALAKEK